MSTKLWEDIVFGPIHSRRLGSSLGVNLLPREGKVCNFDCIYCECGWNREGKKERVLPSKEDVFNALEWKLKELHQAGAPLDSITFSGNGEPTLHPDFPEIIDFTLSLREKYAPNAKVSVLSNATKIGVKAIRDALMKIDNPILKLDSSDDEFAKFLDNPQGEYSIAQIKKDLSYFKGDFILQTMFLRGEVSGRKIDSTEPHLVEGWIKMVLEISPREVMLYTIDRDTPQSGLTKVSIEEMEKISEPLTAAGIKVQIRG